MERRTPARRVFDLHCDTLTECAARGIGLVSDEMPHFSLDRLPSGLRWCQCMAVFMPDSLRGKDAERYFEDIREVYERETALHSRFITRVEDTAAVSAALDRTEFAMILTVEGGSALAGKPENVAKLYDSGVRMMTLTWNAANEIAGGADTDEGFTEEGRAIVAEMERVGMAVDVSHLSDRAFRELCEFAQKPFAASHSNARAVCGHRRNLTDDMFCEIVSRGGVVGLNYSQLFLTDSKGMSATMDDVLRHVHHFLELGGERTLALGSDYDGTDIPSCLDGLDRITNLIDALDRSGIPAETADNILFANAERFFGQLYAKTEDRLPCNI